MATPPSPWPYDVPVPGAGKMHSVDIRLSTHHTHHWVDLESGPSGYLFQSGPANINNSQIMIYDRNKLQ